MITIRTPQVTKSGVRHHESFDIEMVYRHFYLQAEKHYDNIKRYECVMLSRQSEYYKEHMKVQNAKIKRREPYSLPWGSQAKVKYDSEWRMKYRKMIDQAPGEEIAERNESY